MVTERPSRRMTLMQLLTHSEKCTRDLVEYLRATVLRQAEDVRALSRPVRRHSHYPTRLVLCNAIEKMQKIAEESRVQFRYLDELLQEIREQAQRGRANQSKP